MKIRSRQALFVLLAMVLPLFAEGEDRGQSSDITGYVTDASNGEPLPYANVMLLGEEQGTVTNADGYFALVNVPQGVHTLQITYIGYSRKEIVVNNSRQKVGLLRIEMEMEALDFGAIDVIADEYQIMKSSEEVSKITISPRQLNYLPNLGEVDIFRSLQLLPGISGSGDGSSALYVRGGTPDQNMILLDGMTIYQVDHFFGMFSAFNADAIKDVQVYKGGFPAKYGGRLSSVIEMTGKNGDRTRRQFSLGANLLSAQMLYETPIIGGGSWLLSIRRSYTDFLQSPFYDQIYEFVTGDQTAELNNRQRINLRDTTRTNALLQDIVPVFHFYDINTKVSFTPTDRDVLSLSIYNGNDYLDESRRIEGIRIRGPLGRPGNNTTTRIDDNHTDWGNLGASLKWARRWSDRYYTNFLLSSSSFSSNYERHLYNEGGGGRTFRLDEINGVTDYSFRFDNEWYLSDRHKAEFGFSLTDLSTEYAVSFFDTVQIVDIGSQLVPVTLYVQDQWKPRKTMEITIGLRGTVPTKLEDPLALLTFQTVSFETDRLYLEPRASFGWALSDRVRLKGAWGRYQQFVNNIILEDVLQGNSNFWLVSDENFLPGFSEHKILGLRYENGTYLLEVEGYLKTMENLVEFSRRYQSRADYLNFFFFGSGVARGLEILGQKKSGAFNGWISYTLADVTYTFPSLTEISYPADHDRTHELKLVGTYKWGSWNLSATWIYGSGTPYTSPESRYYLPLLNGDVFSYIHISDKNSHRLPEYHRLDLSIYRNLQTPDFNWDFGVSVFNAYNNPNVSYREYDLDAVPVIVSDVLLLGFTPTLFFKVSLK